MAAVHIPHTVVASVACKPIPNPIGPINNPVIVAPENVVGLLSPVEFTALTAGTIGAPVIVTAESITGLIVPSILTPGSVPATAFPVVATAANIPASATPVVVAPESIASIALPTVSTSIAQPATATPAISTAEAIPTTALPTVSTAESVPATALPSVLTAISLPSSNPPFALNHARILYDNLLLGSAVAVSAGDNGSFTLIPNTADRWTTTSGSRTITYTLAANADIDTVCIGAHNLGSSGYSVTVDYSIDLVTAFASFDTSQNPVDDAAMMFHLSSSVSVRRLRITVSGTGNIFVGSVYAGIALQMQRPFFAGHAPITLSATTTRYSSMTEGGNFVGEQIRRLGYKTSADWANLENDWYRFYFQPFVISARTLPFYFAWNLLQYPLDVGYCKTSEDISPAYGVKTRFNVSFSMVGFG